MSKFQNDKEAVDALKNKYDELFFEIRKAIYGQDHIIKQVLISIFSGGHCLLVGVPGLAKTLLVTTIAKSLGLKFKRIQFTPDLMPSDITGTEILGENKQFKFIKGPLFANIILADEINRTPPKTQSALLEAMQERSVTAAGTNYELERPFFVLATQNPIEQEGTYPLPEAQLDRFMFNILLDYPEFKDEITIVTQTTSNISVDINNCISGEEIVVFQDIIRKVPVTPHVVEYAVKLVSMTRRGTPLAHPLAEKYLTWGAGPRASQYLVIGAKAHAVIMGKYTPDIEDVKAVSHAILRHRIIMNYKAEAEGLSVEKIIDELLKA